MSIFIYRSIMKYVSKPNKCFCAFSELILFLAAYKNNKNLTSSAQYRAEYVEASHKLFVTITVYLNFALYTAAVLI
jgi:hypothetical protein